MKTKIEDYNMDMFEFIQPIANNAPDASIGGTSNITNVVINILLGVTLSVSVIALIVSGIQYVASRGDIKATQQAQTSLTYSVIAIIITIAAGALVNIVFNLLGVNLPSGMQDPITPL